MPRIHGSNIQLAKLGAFAPQAGRQPGKRAGPSHIDEQSLAILLDHIIVAGEIADIDEVHGENLRPSHEF
jgi:hypothetical protein